MKNKIYDILQRTTQFGLMTVCVLASFNLYGHLKAKRRIRLELEEKLDK